MSYESDQSAENPVAERDDHHGATSAKTPDAPDATGTAGTADGEDGEVRGSADPGARFREMEISEEEKREIAEERERRLDPANRPEGAEVDNTDRTFEDGEFKD